MIVRHCPTTKVRTFFSRESKYEIKGSKSRGVREKNVLYSNLKNAIQKGKSLKMGQKKAPEKLIKKRAAITAARPARKKYKKSMI